MKEFLKYNLNIKIDKYLYYKLILIVSCYNILKEKRSNSVVISFLKSVNNTKTFKMDVKSCHTLNVFMTSIKPILL